MIVRKFNYLLDTITPNIGTITPLFSNTRKVHIRLKHELALFVVEMVEGRLKPSEQSKS